MNVSTLVVKSTVVASVAMSAAFLCSPLRCAATTGSSWPQFGGDSSHTSYASDPAVTASGASTMGVSWMANMYAADLGSPVVSFNSVLGKSIVYIGDERGDVIAFDASNGQTLWSNNIAYNAAIRATPAVAPDGSVWVGTAYNATLYKLDGATGAVQCSVKAPYTIDGSPMFATPPGGQLTAYFGTVDGPTSGPTFAVQENNCAQEFAFTGYNSTAGPWVTPAYGVSATGEPLVLVGTSDPDESQYAIDAVTGKLVWSYNTFVVPGDYDIGDATMISAPGINGFADGVAYFTSKLGKMYALDLTTGVVLWQTNFCANPCDARSTPAIDGNQLVFGYASGAFGMNATTGATLWSYPNNTEVLSSPVIAGPAGQEVVAFGDIGGTFHVLGLSNGSQLYSHQTGGYITSSPAEANGNILIASTDGFLYSFAAAGGNGSTPSTAITYPTTNSTVTNPNGSLTITGTATDSVAVNSVGVAIQSSGVSGQWYNAGTGTYGNAPFTNPAVLQSPGASTTTWSFTLPAPPSGGAYEVFANSTNSQHLDDHGTTSTFTIGNANGNPVLSVSVPVAAPGGAFNVTGQSFLPGEQVSLSLLGVVSKTVKANAKTGAIANARIQVSGRNAPFGPTAITAKGMTSGKTASVTVDITNEWTQLGFSAARGSFESQDQIIESSKSVGNGSILSQSWDFLAGSPVNSSPAIVNGVAYFGNDAGQMTAVITNTGVPAWSYTTSTGQPIRSSPAIDPSGNVIFGSNDGNLYMLSQSGALISALPLGGTLSSPALANDQTYVTSSNGHLYDVGDPSNALTWTASVAGVPTSPAYDSVANIVVVGDTTGAVTAFNSTTGTQLWKITTGGLVTATPNIFNGAVYVGSADGNFYSINETSGAVNWKYAAGGAITGGSALLIAAPACNCGTTDIAFGDSNGTLYMVQPTGQLVFSQPGKYKGSIIGVGDTGGNIVAETATGFIGATRLSGQSPSLDWSFQSGSSLTTTPAIVDGTLYIGSNNGGFYAFTPHGANPAPASKLKGAIVTVTDANAWSCAAQ